MPSYIAIRDDVTQSLAERDFIVQHTTTASAASAGTGSVQSSKSSSQLISSMRVDGRQRLERRPVSLSLTRSENLATATVTLGAATRATCTVTAELVPPSSSDRPNEGSIQFAVDISPSASTRYRQATPAATTTGGTSGSSGQQQQIPHADRHQKLTANHILRSLERCILQGGALDTEALCVVPGAYVWRLSCHCTLLDDAGNLTDAAVLACLAAVRHYRKPVVELSSSSSSSESGGGIPQLISANLKEPTPLPLHHTPLTISFALYDVTSGASSSSEVESGTSIGMLIDPTAREELCQTGSLTLGMNVHAEICLVDFSGGCELSLADLRICHGQAAAHIGPLCHSLETALQQADAQALADRLAQLQKTAPTTMSLPPMPNGTLEEPDFVMHQEAASDVTVDATMDAAQATHDATAAAAKAEEAYRRQALDYNLGHVASKVREDQDDRAMASSMTNLGSGAAKTSSNLLKAMLQSVQGSSSDVNVASVGMSNAATAATVAAPPPSSQKDRIQKDNNQDKANVAIPKQTIASASTAATVVRKTHASTSLESDEEETTVQLQSEFDSVAVQVPMDSTQAAVVERPASNTVNHEPAVDDDAEIDDLAAAVKSKKKGKKKR